LAIPKDGVKGVLETEKARLLCGVDILETLSGEQLEGLSQRIPRIHLGRGQVLYAPGERSEALFLLKRGRVRLYKTTPDGKEVTLFVVEPGTMFGLMALMVEQLHEEYAEAMEPAEVCIMRREDLERLVREYPEAADFASISVTHGCHEACRTDRSRRRFCTHTNSLFP